MCVTVRDIKHAKATDESSAEDALKKRKRERKATKDLNLLSFGDEEAAFEAPSKQKTKRKKMMSSHDLLDDKKLKSEVDEELLQKIAEAEPSARSEGREKKSEKKLSAKDSLKAAVAAASAGKKEVKSEHSIDEPVDVAPKETPVTETKSKPKEKKKKQELDEYQQLRTELKKSQKAVPVLMGDRAKEQEKERAFHDMLTPLQQQRQKYLQRKKAATRSSRQQDTLEKLKQFQSTLIAANTKKTGSGEEQDQEKSEEMEKKKKEAYHGQVLESDDEDDLKGDLSWMAAKLKFKKHIDVRGVRFVDHLTSVMSMTTNRAMPCCCTLRINSGLGRARQLMYVDPPSHLEPLSPRAL